MKVISPRRVEHIKKYALHYDLVGIPGAGYSFPCNKHGIPLLDKIPESGRENLRKCVSGEHRVKSAKIVDLSRDFRHEEIRECDECHGEATMSRYCGAFVCQDCNSHDGLVRCFCGWSASGGDGYRELVEMGENLEEDY